MRLIILMLCISILLAFSDGSRAQPQPCNQVDQAEQTRCQIEKAIASQNNALMQKIFETSIYAAVNDKEACAGAGYVACAMNSGNLEAAKYLFSKGFDANWTNPKGYQLVGTVIDLGPIGQQQRDDFVVALFGLFLDNGASLDVLTQHYTIWNPNHTILNFLMEKCIQGAQANHARYNRMIQTSIEKNPENIPLAKSAFAFIKQYLVAHPYGDVANCTNMYNWVYSH